MRKYCYSLSVLFVSIGSVNISAPVQAKINSSELEPAIETKLERLTLTIDSSGAIADIERAKKEQQEVNRARKKQEEAQRRAKSKRNYIQILNLATIATNKCYQEKNLVECERLGQIQNTLMTWCQQNDRAACRAYSAVQSNEHETELIQMVGN
ncbi:hypothetical protein [Nostoc sp. NMS9]|uniref:hypothetical protein n=1 Tax=Nostoc sp. NMS9 TaxID=2815393 RepID=UPI0025CC8797|nr:hypothetical protein [Nostoc sp. NMS9]MBN3942741.1 hypothetical protein [Nostoc sp. NMS9]